VTNEADHSISRIDPAMNVVTKTIGIGARSVPMGITVAGGKVWLTTEVAPRRTRVDTG
jgi:DNA-binding beta-propeller fold protein YncE